MTAGEGPGFSSTEADLRTHLAGLDDLEFEREREALAERFGVRVSMLDRMHREERGSRKKRDGGLTLRQFAPWPNPVDGADTLDDLVRSVRRFVAIDEAPLVAVGLWILAAHALDAFGVFPILLVSAATKGCGKSTLLDVMARLVPRPLLSAGSTAAALYRSAAHAPTVLVDEGDAYLGDNRRLVVFFCAGHRRGVPFRLCEGDDNRVVEYPSWCAKVLAMIGRPRDATILDRCIVVELRRKLAHESAEPFSALDAYPELEELGRRCARWAADHAGALREADPEMPAGFSNRVADNWTPLLRVAEVAGAPWPESARKAAAAIGAVEDEALEVLLLRDLRDLFESRAGLYTADLVAELVKIPERPWARVRKGGRPLDGAWLGRTLGPFGIHADRITNGTAQKRGYRRDQFKDAWARYVLPSFRSPEACEASECQTDRGTEGLSGRPDMPDTPDERNEGVPEHENDHPTLDLF